MNNLIKKYQNSEIVGWLETKFPGIAKEQFNLLRDSFFDLSEWSVYTAEKMMLYHVTRKLLGKDTTNYRQEIGDAFLPQTQITIENGFTKNIEDIKLNEIVLNHLSQPVKVTDLIHKKFTGNLITIKIENHKETLTATETHDGMYAPNLMEYPFFQDLNLTHKKFGDFKEGDWVLLPFNEKAIYTNYGGLSRITEIKKSFVKDYDVYCITTEGYHTLIANKIAQKNCVSFGAKNAIEYLQCCQILLSGKSEKFKPIFPPYLYGTGRVQAGGDGGGGDGSLGSWQAKAVMEYGTIPSDLENPKCPSYSGGIARKWGDRPGPPKEFLEVGKTHLVKSAAKISSWEQLCKAISNGYPCTVASNQGFEMTSRDGKFHNPSGNWSHQMCTTPDTIITCVESKRIDQIQVGDEVYTKSGELQKVTKVFKRPYKGKLVVIKSFGCPKLKLTPNHPVLVLRRENNEIEQYTELDVEFAINSSDVAVLTKNKLKLKWVNAEDIKKEDLLISPIPKKTSIKIQNIEQEDYEGEVYNLEVANDPTYIANGIVVHNCIIGFGNNPEPYGIILNSWADCHGRLKDFDNNEDLPIGIIRAKKNVIERMIQAGETFAFSGLEGFPEQRLDRAL